MIKLDICVRVEVRIRDKSKWHRISDLIRFILDNELYDIGSSTSGQGRYIAYYMPDDAKKIKKWLSEESQRDLND